MNWMHPIDLSNILHNEFYNNNFVCEFIFDAHVYIYASLAMPATLLAHTKYIPFPHASFWFLSLSCRL